MSAFPFVISSPIINKSLRIKKVEGSNFLAKQEKGAKSPKMSLTIQKLKSWRNHVLFEHYKQGYYPNYTHLQSLHRLNPTWLKFC